jgi:hypothetical protein
MRHQWPEDPGLVQRPNQPSAQPFEALLIMITAQLLLTVDSLGLCKIAADAYMSQPNSL